MISAETPVDFVQLSKAYAGRWVAIDPRNGTVVASGSDSVEVYEAARASGVDEPLVTLVAASYGDYATWLA